MWGQYVERCCCQRSIQRDETCIGGKGAPVSGEGGIERSTAIRRAAEATWYDTTTAHSNLPASQHS